MEVSPLLADSFAGLPAAYIQVAGADPLRDEGLCYAERLEEDGVPVKLDMSAFFNLSPLIVVCVAYGIFMNDFSHRYPGVPHGFVNYFPELKICQKWEDDFDQGLHWLLQKQYKTV